MSGTQPPTTAAGSDTLHPTQLPDTASAASIKSGIVGHLPTKSSQATDALTVGGPDNSASYDPSSAAQKTTGEAPR